MLHVDFAELNHSDRLLPPATDEDSAGEVARRRVLSRLGSYVSAIVAPLNMRPRQAVLLYHDTTRVEVRVSAAVSSVLVVIAPEGDLGHEAFFLSVLRTHNLPGLRVLAQDLSRSQLPFTFLVQSYAGGAGLDHLSDESLMRVAAKQIGRTLRRVHQVPAPAFGRPMPGGRWLDLSWREMLEQWLELQQLDARLEAALGAEVLAAFRETVLESALRYTQEPRVTHGALTPHSAIVTTAESAQLEALTRPGLIVGGDPLFDLAYGMRPSHPALFRQGLLEGYVAHGALTPEQQTRLAQLQQLVAVLDALDTHDATALERLGEQLLNPARA